VGNYGREDDVAVQEELVKLNHEVPRDFPAGALAEAQNLPDGPTPEDMRKPRRLAPTASGDHRRSRRP